MATHRQSTLTQNDDSGGEMAKRQLRSFIGGSPKYGPRFLLRQQEQHPRVSMLPMNELHYYSADLASRIIRRAQCCIGLFAWVAEALKAKGLRITTKVLQEGHDVPR